MKPEREIIVLGDIEMGGGTLTDDFISDNALSELVLKLSHRPHPVDLVFNGDTFDFLKCPYIINQTTTYPRHITPEISMAKLELMHAAHKKVFDALHLFVRKSKNNIYFIIGNHDYDLSYPQVQHQLKEYLGHHHNIFFSFQYEKHQVYAEHGHQYDLLNKINYKLMFLTYEGKRILNLPWASFGLISKYMHVKEQYPFMERIFPRPALLSWNRNIRKMVTFHSIRYIFLTLFYYPIRYAFDPTYTFPKKLFWNFFRRIKTKRWETDNIVSIFRKDKKHLLRKNKILIFGHNHRYSIKQKRKYVLIQLDCWRDEYLINSKAGLLTPKVKDYAQILITTAGPQWKVLQYPVKRSLFKLRSMTRDEIKYLRKAAKEEGFKLKI